MTSTVQGCSSTAMAMEMVILIYIALSEIVQWCLTRQTQGDK